MTTIKEILDKFNSKYRYAEPLESIDIGDYSFDEAYTDNGHWILEFISNTNPDVWLDILDDSGIIHLIKKIDDETVDLTMWWCGKKSNTKRPFSKHKPLSKNKRKPFLTKNEK